MGSLLLFVLGAAAPLVVALVMLAGEERRRLRARSLRDKQSAFQKVVRGTALSAASMQPAPVHTAKEASGGHAPFLGLNERDAAVVREAIEDWGVGGLVAALDRLKGRLAAVAEMEMIWADPHTHLAQEQPDMLERALWVFEPEYVVGQGRFDVDPRIGAVAKPVVGASLIPGRHIKDGEPVLVVELKNARTTIGAEEQQRAWANVRDLIRGGAVKERDQVDVFVVGGEVDELDGNPRVEGRYRNVRINSYDYGQFVTRAKRLTFGLYDELKDQAPFLRRHREEIVAAQQAAAEQAAAEAAAAAARAEAVEEAPVGAPAAVEPEPDLIREEEFADAPRRGEYEEEVQEAPVVTPVARVPAPVGPARGPVERPRAR